MTVISNKLAIVILAAGEAKRFGSPKQLASYHDKPLLQHVVECCSAINICDNYVVLGAYAQQIQQQIPFENCDVIDNPSWHLGMSGSIKRCIETIGGRYQAILFIAGDQVLISPQHLTELIDKWHRQPNELVCATFDDKVSIPAIFPQPFYAQLLSLTGDKGGKSILLNNRANLSTVNLTQAAVDIDTPADLKRLISMETL